MNCVVGPKNALVYVFLCFWLGREQPWDPAKNIDAGNTDIQTEA